MANSMRKSTLETLGLGSPLDIFRKGRLPANPGDLVDEVFGKAGSRGALVISGANGIVGAGKMMQLGIRLLPYDVPLVGLDVAGAPDGIGAQYAGLVNTFGRKRADEIMANIILLKYDGAHLPNYLKALQPRFLLEAIPEILELKRTHYQMFRAAFPEIEIRSVTSGFPMSELGVGIAHPAFPHQINKIWEIVEEKPSAVTQLFWALGMLPIPVSDNWSFVLDVLFCGLTLSGLKYHQASNMPFWKLDKYIRKLLGPNPYRAHDVIGAKGANFLTWSCLNDLSKHYGKLFEPTPALVEHKDSGQNWFPLNHLRPVVNRSIDDEEMNEFETWILGSLFQMTSIMLQEKRSHLAFMNSIGELCAQFRKGILAVIRSYGADKAIGIVEEYHKLSPEAGSSGWYPDIFERINEKEWQQLYVNAEHDGKVGVITVARESYNHDVNAELNRAIDWLKAEGIDRVIISGDFHLSTQLVGADTSDFYPALNNTEEGFNVSYNWSQTARRLSDEFKVSVGFINGKRCLGGMLELLIHCHYLVSLQDAELGAPEVTLPVIPGMEMCHWSFRKANPQDWHKLLGLLLEGKSIKAPNAVGWLIDYAGSMDDALQMVWKIANDGETALPKRKLADGKLKDFPADVSGLSEPADEAIAAARKAIFESIRNCCNADLSEALTLQARYSGDFMTSKYCQNGIVGGDYKKTTQV